MLNPHQMREMIKNEEGFTLIEMLLVMMIIVILAGIVVGGYTSYRRTALLDLAVDSVYSQVSELRSRVAGGLVGGERLADLRSELEGGDESDQVRAERDCRGIFIEREGEDYQVRIFNQDFVNQQIWNEFEQEWDYRGCGPFSAQDPNLSFSELVLDEEVSLVAVDYQGQPVTVDFVLRFAPPEGKIEYRLDGANFAEAFEDERLEMIWQYGEVEDADLQRILDYSLLSGTGERKLIE